MLPADHRETHEREVLVPVVGTKACAGAGPRAAMGRLDTKYNFVSKARL